jgi:hypothetical protein
MKISTLNEPQRLERVFHNVVHALHRRVLPELHLRESRMFSVTGGVIKNITDDGTLVVSLVDELAYNETMEQFLPTNAITIYASKHEDGKMKPVKRWLLDPEKTDEIAFVIAYFFLGHSHLLNRHFSTANLRDMFFLSAERTEELMK